MDARRRLSVQDSSSWARLEKKVMALEARIEDLEKRPRAGRPAKRIEEAMNFLASILTRVDRTSHDVMIKAVTAGFSEVLIRKAARRLEVRKVNGLWHYDLGVNGEGVDVNA
jgi:hypothetical protein